MAGGRRQNRDEQALTGRRGRPCGESTQWTERQQVGSAMMEPDTKYRNKKNLREKKRLCGGLCCGRGSTVGDRDEI